MRFALKFTNGFWKTFDTVDYTDVRLHYLRIDAERHVNFLNNAL